MKTACYVLMLLGTALSADESNVSNKPKPAHEDSLAILNGMHRRILNAPSLSGYYSSYCGPLAVDSKNTRFLVWNPNMDGVWVIRKPVKDNGIKFMDPASEALRVVLYKSNPGDAVRVTVKGAPTWVKVMFNPNAQVSDNSKAAIVADLGKDDVVPNPAPAKSGS